MDAEQVVSKILSDAQNQADEIKKESDKTIAAHQSQLDAELADFDKQTDALAQTAAKETKEHFLAAARMQNAKDMLAEKIAILKKVFDNASERILKLSDEQYRDLITKLLLKAVETGSEEVIIDTNEKRIDQPLIESVNKQLEGKGNLKLSNEKAQIGAGFILSKGNISTNVSLDVMFEQARIDLQIELAKELFGN
ncbi:MAG: hypothetical protein ISS77_02370 [Phycisphaerae bacterium]|nr:hypothetical protein [Phycisphaerae bacterium]